MTSKAAYAFFDITTRARIRLKNVPEKKVIEVVQDALGSIPSSPTVNSRGIREMKKSMNEIVDRNSKASMGKNYSTTTESIYFQKNGNNDASPSTVSMLNKNMVRSNSVRTSWLDKFHLTNFLFPENLMQKSRNISGKDENKVGKEHSKAVNRNNVPCENNDDTAIYNIIHAHTSPSVTKSK